MILRGDTFLRKDDNDGNLMKAMKIIRKSTSNNSYNENGKKKTGGEREENVLWRTDG